MPDIEKMIQILAELYADQLGMEIESIKYEKECA